MKTCKKKERNKQKKWQNNTIFCCIIFIGSICSLLCKLIIWFTDWFYIFIWESLKTYYACLENYLHHTHLNIILNLLQISSNDVNLTWIQWDIVKEVLTKINYFTIGNRKCWYDQEILALLKKNRWQWSVADRQSDHSRLHSPRVDSACFQKLVFIFSCVLLNNSFYVILRKSA